MTDRDIFAAAALTGLLSNIPRYQNGPVTEQAYELAEFMLRERDKTNHDAVPEARADGQGRDNPDTPDRVGTGNTQKPVAWARFFPNGGPMSVFLDRPPADAEPLYRSPTLTDEEREAIRWAAEIACADDSDDFALWNAGIMQRMLEQLGGSNG